MRSGFIFALLPFLPLIQEAAAQPSPPAQEAVLRFYRYQERFLQAYRRALETRNGWGAAQAISGLTRELIQWGQEVSAGVSQQDFQDALLLPQSIRAREQCDAFISQVQQESAETYHEGFNFIMMHAPFKRACADFSNTLQQFKDAMGL